MKNQDKITVEEAAEEVKMAYRRIGILHLAYAETLLEKMGEKEGKALILAAIKNYGIKIGNEVREKVEKEGMETEPDNFGKGSSRNLPRFGISDTSEEVKINGEKRQRAYGCVMAKVWKEYGREDLGKLYCYVDPAKFMAFNSDYKMIHTKNELDGDNYCEFAIRKTTKKEREDFVTDGVDWSYIDNN